MKTFTLVLVAAALAACSHRTIGGTNIPDNRETREVLDTFSKFKNAFEARDSRALLALVAPTYYDAADPSHPVDYDTLKKKLPHDFDNVPGVKLEVTIKDIEVKGAEARLDYYQVLRYAVKTPTDEKWKPSSDDARMRFVRVDGDWKIASGL